MKSTGCGPGIRHMLKETLSYYLFSSLLFVLSHDIPTRSLHQHTSGYGVARWHYPSVISAPVAYAPLLQK
jgi:hypothetical protein